MSERSLTVSILRLFPGMLQIPGPVARSRPGPASRACRVQALYPAARLRDEAVAAAGASLRAGGPTGGGPATAAIRRFGFNTDLTVIPGLHLTHASTVR
jgi:hypothetical protein